MALAATNNFLIELATSLMKSLAQKLNILVAHHVLVQFIDLNMILFRRLKQISFITITTHHLGIVFTHIIEYVFYLLYPVSQIISDFASFYF